MGVAYILNHMHELNVGYPYEAAQCDGEYLFVILSLIGMSENYLPPSLALALKDKPSV